MKIWTLSAVGAAAFLVASAGALWAQGARTGVNTGQSPGHQMQDKGSRLGQPGASGYSPGHQMQEKGSRLGRPGASGYAPGHNKGGNTGTNTRTRDTDRIRTQRR